MTRAIRHLVLSLACLSGIWLPAGEARAQQKVEEVGLTITTTPAVVSDYRFRGISQTRRDPAAQITLDIEHESGLYIGGFISNVTFSGLDATLETDGLIGFRFAAAGFKFDLGGIYYGYPGYTRPEGGYRLDYYEIAARVSREFDPVTVLGAVYWSPDFSAQSGSATYIEGGVDVKLPFEFILSGRLGYQWIDRNTRFGTPDYANWSVSVSRDLWGFTFSAGYYDTNVSRADCVGGQDICGATALFSVARKF